MANDLDGCGCDGFASARTEHFIERREDRYFLADQPSAIAGSGWSMRYGPEIAHCPFCGHALGKVAELPRARAT